MGARQRVGSPQPRGSPQPMGSPQPHVCVPPLPASASIERVHRRSLKTSQGINPPRSVTECLSLCVTSPIRGPEARHAPPPPPPYPPTPTPQPDPTPPHDGMSSNRSACAVSHDVSSETPAGSDGNHVLYGGCTPSSPDVPCGVQHSWPSHGSMQRSGRQFPTHPLVSLVIVASCSIVRLTRSAHISSGFTRSNLWIYSLQRLDDVGGEPQTRMYTAAPLAPERAQALCRGPRAGAKTEAVKTRPGSAHVDAHFADSSARMLDERQSSQQRRKVDSHGTLAQQSAHPIGWGLIKPQVVPIRKPCGALWRHSKVKKSPCRQASCNMTSSPTRNAIRRIDLR